MKNGSILKGTEVGAAEHDINSQSNEKTNLTLRAKCKTLTGFPILVKLSKKYFVESP